MPQKAESTMRLSGTPLTALDQPGVTIHIEDDRIVSIEPGTESPHRIIAPAFIDAHLHLPQFDAIGELVDHHDEGALLGWLEASIFPHEQRWEDPDHAEAMATRVGRSLLARGTVGICAYATVHRDATERAMHALASLGLRGRVGQVLMDRHAPPALTRPASRLLEEASTLSAIGRIEPIVTPRFAISCTPDLLRGAADLARDRQWPIQTHLAETRAECRRVADLFDGRRYLDVYADAGLLTDSTIFAHAIWLDDDDRSAIADANSIIAHCPTANAFLGSGSMDLRAMRDTGIHCVLGTDIAGGPDRSMVRVARAMIETAQRLGHEPPTPRQAWHAITTGNADALGWTDAGRLEPGAAADLLVIEPDVDWRRAADPYARLLYAWDDRWLTRTICRGKVAFTNPERTLDTH